MIEILGTILLFFGCVIGLAWPLAANLALDPGEKMVATVVLSLVGSWLIGWVVYVMVLPTLLLWAVPALAILNLALTHRSLGATLRSPIGTEMAVAHSLVTAASIGWLALVGSYSGGDWIGDWFGHWDRARFFLERWPRDILFTGFDPLTSRPPLANVVTGIFLRISRLDFAHYQIVTTLLNALAFLPAALLVRRFHPAPEKTDAPDRIRAVRLLAVLFMVNSLFVQNSTYAWTKLMAAFFVLAAVYFFLRAHDPDAPPSAGILCATSLAAGTLAHYSTGPFVVVLVIAWLTLGAGRWREQRWRNETLVAAATGAVLLATWFAWAVAVFGWQRTLLSNPSVTDGAPTVAEHLWRAGLNIRDTLVPHFLRSVDFSPFSQRSTWGTWRDWSFLVYQRNLFIAMGSVAWIAILVTVWRLWHGAATRARWFWLSLIVGTVALGVAAHGPRDPWGNTHIGEQPVVLLGLALLAAHWSRLTPLWRRFLIAGAACDFVVGLALHFGVQSYLLDRWLSPGRSAEDVFTSYSKFAAFNLYWKSRIKADFFSDILPAHPALVIALLGALLFLALYRTTEVKNSP